MSRKRRSLHKGSRRREVFDLTLVEFLVTNDQRIFHSPVVDQILEQATLLLRAEFGPSAER